MTDIIDLIYEDHDWLRRHFRYLDGAATEAELTSIWEPLAVRLDTHADAEEAVFYPALLDARRADNPQDETDDAITDHNEIRDAVRRARQHKVGSAEWFAAVQAARSNNGQHLDEEEREALPDFSKSTTFELRHELAMKWLAFYHRHPNGSGVDTTNKDPHRYVQDAGSADA